MDITIEHLRDKRHEYERGYTEHLALANAHHGAMEAIDELIALKNKEEGGDLTAPLEIIEESKE